MTLEETAVDTIEAFRQYIEDSVALDDRYGVASRNDRQDGSTLATRFALGESCWFEVAVRPLIPQVRVGFVTRDRGKSEECEQAIRDSGKSMGEFVGAGFGEVGLNWEEPPVERCSEDGEDFCFATPLAVEDLVDLDTEEVRNKVLRMLDGYLIAFGAAIEVGEE